jgi:uncharacterized protein
MNFIILITAVAAALLIQTEARRNVYGKTSETPDPLPPTALPKNSILVPLMRQSTFYTCGVASLQSCLYYWQVFDSTEEQLAIQCGTTEENGTPPENLVTVAKFYNLTAVMKENSTLKDLEIAINKGYTVILDVQAWDGEENVDWVNEWEDGHYVVLVGLDSDYVFLMDPSTGGTYAYVPRNEFVDRWHDYEILSDGSRREYVHTAIYIHGDNPWLSPHSITYMG